MDLNAVKMFVAVVQAGSLSKASERLNVPIATLSRNIAALERDLHTQLLERLKSGVKPTLSGSHFYEQVVQAIELLAETERDTHDLSGNLHGILRVSAPPYFTPAVDWITRFQAAFPNVNIHLDMSTRVVDFAADDVDVAFRMGGVAAENVIARQLADVPIVMVAAPNLLAKYGLVNDLADLQRMPCAGWALHFHSPSLWELNGRLLNLPFKYTSNDSSAIHHLAKTGAAVAWLPEFVVREDMARGDLVAVLPDVPRSSFAVFMVYASRRYQAAVVRAFVDFVMGEAA